MDRQSFYVSITGLKSKTGFWNQLRFWWYAIPSMVQAKRAPGNISADARTINGIHHTLTVWDDKDAMRTFMVAGAHRRAMAAFSISDMGTGRIYGFVADQVPEWSIIPELLLANGRVI